MNMEGGEWHTVCHTCSEEDRSSDYADASAFFDRHAAAAHDVEMHNLAVVDAGH